MRTDTFSDFLCIPKAKCSPCHISVTQENEKLSWNSHSQTTKMNYMSPMRQVQAPLILILRFCYMSVYICQNPLSGTLRSIHVSVCTSI